MKVFQEWSRYRRDIVPAGATGVQVEECRRAFYAGAWSLYTLMMEAIEPADDRECDRRLAALHDEVIAITRDLALEVLRKLEDGR